ncbi:MAG: hypothetical protein ACI9W4_001623 [Rhodothermales bacterium]|jgi:hypothetical protein
MSDEKKTNDAFHNLRDGFDDLQVDEQARFLVEAAMALVANGAREAGNAVSSVVDDLVENLKAERDACCDDDADPTPEPEPKPAAKAKPAAKKTTRKRAPKKPAADAGDA